MEVPKMVLYNEPFLFVSSSLQAFDRATESWLAAQSKPDLKQYGDSDVLTCPLHTQGFRGCELHLHWLWLKIHCCIVGDCGSVRLGPGVCFYMQQTKN